MNLISNELTITIVLFEEKKSLVFECLEELNNVELSEATKELEKATSAVEEAETSKARLDASVELKKATARLEAINYLS